MSTINNPNNMRGDLRFCSLCQSDYEEGENKSALNCEHVFHSDCLTDMRRFCASRQASRCPLCLERITSINGQAVEPINGRRDEEQIHEDEILALQLQNQWRIALPNIQQINIPSDSPLWLIRLTNELSTSEGITNLLFPREDSERVEASRRQAEPVTWTPDLSMNPYLPI